MEEGGSRLQPPSVFMLTLSLIGIGCGDPEQLTLAAIRAINAADLVLIPRNMAHHMNPRSLPLVYVLIKVWSE